MSYIENLTGNTIEGGLQETLALGAGNLTNTGDYLVLNSGIALIDGLRIKSTGNLKLPIVDTFNKYILLRIRTYTEVVDGLTVRKAELSLIAQTSSTPVNNRDLYTNIVGTKDVLLAQVTSEGVVSEAILYALLPYDSGWVKLTPATNYTGDVYYRLWNKVLYFRGIFSRTTGNVVSGDVITYLPYGILQRQQDAYATAKGSAGTPLNLTFKLSGEISVQINAGNTSTVIGLDGVSFKL